MATGKVTNCFKAQSSISAKEFDRIETAAKAVAKEAGRPEPINQDYVTVVKGLLESNQKKLDGMLAANTEVTDVAKAETAQQGSDEGSNSTGSAATLGAKEAAAKTNAGSTASKNAGASEKAVGSNAKAVESDLRKFMRVGTLGNRVVVVQSANDLPSGLRKSVGVTGDTQAFVSGGKAYLIADNIAPGKARAVFLHEVGAHLGMENLLGDYYDSMVDKIVEWAGKTDGSLESKLAVRALQRVRSAGTPDAQANTELVAYFIEEAVDAGVNPMGTTAGPLAQFMRRVRDAFKAALTRLGFNTDKMTAQDFVDIAYGAARMELKSDGVESGAAQSVRWSDKDSNNPVGRDAFLKQMHRKMRDAYDESTSPDDAVDAFMEVATAQEQAFMRALKKDDYLGFDYPHQAIEAIYEDLQEGTSNFDLSPQLKAAISRAGNAQFSKASTLPALTKPAYMNKAPNELWESAKGLAIMLKDAAFTRVAFTRNLLEAAQKYLPAAANYMRQMNAARVESNHLQRQVADIVERAEGLSAAERGTGADSVNDIISQMTYGNKWAFAPDWYKDAKVDYVLSRKFNAMSSEAQSVIKDVFRHGYETLKLAQQAALDSIKSEVDPLIAEARAKGDMETVKELEKAKADADGRFRKLMSIRSTTPYAPLKRYGNWAVVVKSQRYLDAEARNDEKELEELTSDGNHYQVEFVSNQFVARARARELEGQVGNNKVYFFERTDGALLYGGESVFKTFSRFRNLARDRMDGETAKVVEALDKTLASMYVSLVAETSARSAEANRKNVFGADKDMLRAFATHGQAMAHFIGSLKTSGEVAETLRVMKGQVKTSGDVAQASVLYSEILRRHAMGLDYEPNQLLDKSLAFNSYWSLITSPSYLLTNLTQPWAVSLPYMAGKFGLWRTKSELVRAYKDIGAIALKLVDNPEAVSKLPDDVRDVVQKLLDRGSIDISIGTELGTFTSPGESKVAAGVQKAIRFPRTLAERGEMVNRVATAVAAYRLAKQAKMGNDAATDYADKVIYNTHGDYSAFNTPRFMRTGAGRLMTQFRKFQLIQLSLYTRMIADSFGNGTPEEKAAARWALGYSLGTTFALGGVMALPGFTAISFLLGALGDDDTPDDPEATLRRALGGGAEADALLRGIPNMLGLNLSNRIGAGGMLSILPYTDLEASRDGYKDILLGVAGPFVGGTLPKALDGVGLIGNGDYWKGLEMLLPRGFADVSKAMRFGTEGITKRNGDVVLSGDDVGVLAASAQLFGLPTKSITDNQMLRNSQFKADEFYRDRTTDLKRDYVQAYRSNDIEKMAKVRAKWMETQDARRALGYKVQPLSTLLKAPQEQRKREAKPLNKELIQ